MSAGKWTIPLALAGLGGLGAMLFSTRGQKLIRSTAGRSGDTSGRMAAWSLSAQTELDHIQRAVKNLEQSLGTHPARNSRHCS